MKNDRAVMNTLWGDTPEEVEAFWDRVLGLCTSTGIEKPQKVTYFQHPSGIIVKVRWPKEES